MKKFAIVCIVVLLCLSLVIGLYNISSIESLMRPPKLSGESRLLQQAFEETVNKSEGIVMKNPLSGDYKSSYLFFDLDNDDIEEAFVFYSDLSEDNLACVSIFKKIDNEWNFVSKIKGRNENFYEVNFADINGDSIYEILLSCKNSEELESVNSKSFGTLGDLILSVYRFDNASTTLLKTETYSNLHIFDINKDNSDDFFFVNISLSDQEKKTTGRILSFNKDYSVAQEKTVLLTGILEVYNIATDTIEDAKTDYTRIFIDGAISERGLITEVLCVAHNDFSLTLPLYEQNQSVNPVSLRDSKVLSMDFDDDGKIEIPTLEIFPSAEHILKGLDERAPLNLTVWNELDGLKLVNDKKCILNSSYGYLLVVDESWINSITAVYNSNNLTLTFYYLNDDGVIDNEIFSIRAFTIPEWEKDDSGYSRITETSSYIYALKFKNDDMKTEFDDYVKQNFHVYN